MERNNELIFGYGRFQCLGKNVAFIELNKIFVELLRTYDWSIVDSQKPWKSFCAGIFLQRDMWVRVTARTPVMGKEEI
jgi:cytochrome P450